MPTNAGGRGGRGGFIQGIRCRKGLLPNPPVHQGIRYFRSLLSKPARTNPPLQIHPYGLGKCEGTRARRGGFSQVIRCRKGLLPNPPVQEPNPPVQEPNPPVQEPNPPVQQNQSTELIP